MKLHNERAQIRELPRLFRAMVANPLWGSAFKDRQPAMLAQIEALNPETATARDVEAITGLNSLVRQLQCEECGTYSWDIVLFEDCDAGICLDCLQQAVSLAEGAKSTANSN